MIFDGQGGANTRTGLEFEDRVDIRQLFENIDGYHIRDSTNDTGYEIWHDDQLLAYCFKKHEIYRFLAQEPYCINWKDYFSKKLLQ